MPTKIQKWGNSQGIRIPRDVLAKAGVRIGQDLDVSARNGCITIRASRKIRGKYQIEKLVAKIPKKPKFKEVDWGKPRGREVW